MQHMKFCMDKVKEIFPGGVYKKPLHYLSGLMKMKPEYLLKTDIIHFLLVLTLSVFSEKNLPLSGLKLSYKVFHVPMSVASASCVPGKEDPVCFVSKGNEEDLGKNMLDYLEHLANTGYLILKEKFKYVFEYVTALLFDLDGLFILRKVIL